MQVSSHIARLKESATLAVAAKANALKSAGKPVINFGVGEPDFDTPANIREAAKRALDANVTRYAPTAGDKPSREAVARKFREENGIACRAEDITLTAGAKHGVYMSFAAILEPGAGDEVILPTPSWVSYRPLIELSGGVCVEVPSSVETNFKITPAQLEAAITPRTRAIMLNSPSNPCGTVYTTREYAGLIDVLARHQEITVVSDEIYEKLIYPEIEAGLKHVSPGSDPRLAERTITINGMSKAFAMTGWRAGYLVAPGRDGMLAKAIIKLQGQMTNSIPSFIMPAIVEALNNSAPGVETMRKAFAGRAVLVHGLLSSIKRFKTVKSTGAFYAFPSIEACFGLTTKGGRKIDSAQAFAESLLEESFVAIVPGEDFGECARRNIRISFACSEADLREGMERIRNFVEALS
ncbi:MAG: pyridoxal phosphate-dependent aminotransferase [Planctomycetes bacterium]|nr:pyridoxal phosphate-dependent aminotransferase [Planctomycetota bacterium]